MLTLTAVVLSAVNVSADSVYKRKRKSVYLVLDDSGSMKGKKEQDANYALQTFLATLDKDDEVNVYFLNAHKQYGDIDISQKSDEFLANIRKNFSYDRGGTPFDEVTVAADDLIAAVKPDSDKEYWLVVITDGGFAPGFNVQNYLENFTNTPLKNQEYPKFMYFGIQGGEILTVPQGAENRFFTETENDIITALNEATLTITNRQKVNATNNGDKTLSFDLDYPARNIVVLAQNKRTKPVGADSASSLNISERYEVQYPEKNPDLQYTTVCYITEQNQSSIQSGRVELTFDTEISANDVVVLAEPAIGIISRYTDEDGNEVLPEDFYLGEQIRAEMIICDSETNAPIPGIDRSKINQKISVNGVDYDGNIARFTIEDPDVIIDMKTEFDSGLTLDLHDEAKGLKPGRLLSLFISDSGKFSHDIDKLNNAKGIRVTPLNNGSELEEDDFEKSNLEVLGGGFFTNRFDIEKDKNTKSFIIHPKAGFAKVFTPEGEQQFEIKFSDKYGEELTGNIYVEVTGKRPWIMYIIILLVLVLVIYLIVVELTRKRFPRGSYLKYFTLDENFAPEGALSDSIPLNRPSIEKLLNGSYLPIPFWSYKVKGENNPCDKLTFVPGIGPVINVYGVEKTTINNDYGTPIETTTFIPIDEDGEELAVSAPIEDSVDTQILTLSAGNYLRDLDGTIGIRYSTKKYDKETGHQQM